MSVRHGHSESRGGREGERARGGGRNGGEDGPRRAEGIAVGKEGEEKREQMSVVRGCCGPRSLYGG